MSIASNFRPNGYVTWGKQFLMSRYGQRLLSNTGTFIQLSVSSGMTEGQYEFLNMPFGLKNASSVFQHDLYTALGNLAYTYLRVHR